ncbi:hypothetical protein [Streptomyces cinereoruber]|uniref:hypothetical protein n=1 Tax=Streptomyces cinereoruber TaxID=67260 RepID=UPI001266A794|nr:hypothetical protein [Streptomyces cinereoruber]
MNDVTSPAAPGRRTATGRLPGRIGSAVCAVVLLVAHFGTAYLLLLAYAAEPAGPWDTETVSHSGFAAGTALGVTVVAALLTVLFVKAQWLRRWWFVVPTVTTLAALLRLTVLAPEL